MDNAGASAPKSKDETVLPPTKRRFAELPAQHAAPVDREITEKRSEPIRLDPSISAVAVAKKSAKKGATSSSSSVQAGEYHDHDFDFEEVVAEGEAYDQKLQAFKKAPAASEWSPVGQKVTERKCNKSSGDVQEDWATTHDGIERAWEGFHARNRGHFFKRRRYLVLAFPDLLRVGQPSSGCNAGADAGAGAAESVSSTTTSQRPRPRIVELGCGCGSTILTLLLSREDCVATAVDISASAIGRLDQLLEEHGLQSRCDTAVVDVAATANGGSLQKLVPSGTAAAVVLLFALSAMRYHVLQFFFFFLLLLFVGHWVT